MTTYRVIKAIRTGGRITDVVVKTDTGKRLKDKKRLPLQTVLARIHGGDLFYDFDKTKGVAAPIHKVGNHAQSVGDQDLQDNLGAL